MFLEISQSSQENTCETQAQVFSCKFCEISKNLFFTEHLRTTASGLTNIDPVSVPHIKMKSKQWHTTLFLSSIIKFIEKLYLKNFNLVKRSIAEYDLPSTNSALVLFLGKTKLLSCHELDNAYLSLVRRKNQYRWSF